MIVESGRKRLKEKHIKWEENYGEKSKIAKEHFDKQLPGSYFRWVGKDYEDGVWRYVVVGPAISKREGKSFFAGNKKMPKEPGKKAYSPSGKYFPNLRGALSYAAEMWGIRVPQDAGNYTKDDLGAIDIPRHIKG
jgi:hypothetical protein